MLNRSLTILLGVPVILACVYFGGIPFLLLMLALALIAVNEFYNLMMKKGFFPAYYVGNAITASFIIFAYYAVKRNWEPAHSAILTLAAAIAMISGVFLKREKDTIVDVAVTILGMVYVGWFLSYLFFLRSLTDHGGYLFFPDLYRVGDGHFGLSGRQSVRPHAADAFRLAQKNLGRGDRWLCCCTNRGGGF